MSHSFSYQPWLSISDAVATKTSEFSLGKPLRLKLQVAIFAASADRSGPASNGGETTESTEKTELELCD